MIASVHAIILGVQQMIVAVCRSKLAVNKIMVGKHGTFVPVRCIKQRVCQHIQS